MAAKVYANGMEVSGKASSNKVLGSMPDVCLSPPSPPAGPIPIPYPNFAQASDTTDGSKNVKAGGKEINLKGKSKYKKSKGDEAATRSFGAGLISHNISGAVKHKAGSFDVKVEGSSVVRHLDLTTGNHSNPGDGNMALDAAKAKAAAGKPLDCEELDSLNKDARDNDVTKMDGTTVTTASRTDGFGATKIIKAATPMKNICTGKTSGYRRSVGKTTGRTKVDKSMLCDENPDPGYHANSKNHTEPKLLEPEWRQGGSITMKIFHQPAPRVKKLKEGVLRRRRKPADSMPCPTCKKAICVANGCGLHVILCNNENEKVDTKKLCDNSDPKSESEWKAEGFGEIE